MFVTTLVSIHGHWRSVALRCLPTSDKLTETKNVRKREECYFFELFEMRQSRQHEVLSLYTSGKKEENLGDLSQDSR